MLAREMEIFLLGSSKERFFNKLNPNSFKDEIKLGFTFLIENLGHERFYVPAK